MSEVSLCRGTSLIRNRVPIGRYSKIMPRTLYCPWGGLMFLMSEETLEMAAACKKKTPRLYMGTSLMRKTQPHRITIGP